MKLLRSFVPALLLVAAASASAAPRVPTPTGARADLPIMLRERARARQFDARAAAGAMMIAAPVPAGAPLVSRRFDPDVTGSGAIGDAFGNALAVDGDTLVVAALLDIVNVPNRRGGAACGSLTVFERVAGGWAQSAVLVPPTFQTNEQAGVAVALRGDVAVAGARFGTPASTVPESGIAHVFLRTAGSWAAVARLEPPDARTGSRFGEAVATDGDTIVVGAPRYPTTAGAEAGAAFVFIRSGDTWVFVRQLTAPDGAAGDRFGTAVAIEGDEIFVGAPLDDDRGSVHAFTRGAGDWPFVAKTAAPSSTASARFGSALALDATHLVVGAPGDALPAGVAHGTAAVYGRMGTTLSSPAVLAPPDGAPSDAFGTALALDDTTLLVGAPGRNTSEGAGYVFVDGGAGYVLQATLEQPDGPFAETTGSAVALYGDEALLGSPLDDIAPNRAQGSVRRFARSGATWSDLPQIDLGDGAAFESFGISVAATDTRVAIGAFLDDTIAAGDDAGSVTIYARNGAAWVREARLEAADAISEDRLGISVALSDDEVLAGSYFNVVSAALNQGAVYDWRRDASGAWVQAQKIVVDEGRENDFFGFSLARDGDTLLVGAPGASSATQALAGAAFVFERTASGWERVARLDAPSSAPAEGFAGIAVALEGDIALVGAPDSDVGDNLFQGLVHVYVRGPSGWQYARTIAAPDGAAEDEFGIALAFDGGLAVIGASNAEEAALRGAGAVYAYALDVNGETLLGRLASPLPSTAAGYGLSLGLDRERLLVGAPLAPGPGGELGQGRVWSMSRTGTSLGAQQPVDAPTTKPLQLFGRSLAFSFRTTAVGASEFQRDNPREGAAYALDDPDRLYRDGFE